MSYTCSDWKLVLFVGMCSRECVGEARKREEKLTNLFVYMAHDCTGKPHLQL